VRPAHLRIVNPLHSAHISQCGSRNGAARLTNRQVQKIRRLYHKGYTQKELAKLYGMSTVAIHKIVTRKTWKHISNYR
jgi:hypothetical protein